MQQRIPIITLLVCFLLSMSGCLTKEQRQQADAYEKQGKKILAEYLSSRGENYCIKDIQTVIRYGEEAVPIYKVDDVVKASVDIDSKNHEFFIDINDGKIYSTRSMDSLGNVLKQNAMDAFGLPEPRSWDVQYYAEDIAQYNVVEDIPEDISAYIKDSNCVIRLAYALDDVNPTAIRTKVETGVGYGIYIIEAEQEYELGDDPYLYAHWDINIDRSNESPSIEYIEYSRKTIGGITVVTNQPHALLDIQPIEIDSSHAPKTTFYPSYRFSSTGEAYQIRIILTNNAGSESEVSDNSAIIVFLDKSYQGQYVNMEHLGTMDYLTPSSRNKDQLYYRIDYAEPFESIMAFYTGGKSD